MNPFTSLCRAVSAVSLICMSSQAAVLPLRLQASAPVGKEVAAFPRVILADVAIARRINATLQKADAGVRVAAKECRAAAIQSGDETKGEPDFERTIWVTMRGPRFLAFQITDNTACGGAHPNNVLFGLTFDLQTGATVNWQDLLSRTLVSKVNSYTSAGIKLTEVSSPVLQRLFMATLLAVPGSGCRHFSDGMAMDFEVWPEPKSNGLGLYDADVPFAAGPCGGPVIIPLAQLQKAGATPGFLGAIGAARRHQSYGPVYSGL